MCGKKFLLLAAVILVVFAIPLSVTSFIFGQNDNNSCDLNNVFGYDLRQYLFGINITGITAIIAIIVLLVLLIFLKEIPIIGKIITIILVVIVGILWGMVASYILLHRGSACVGVGITYFGYSGVLIVLAVVTFFVVK